MTRSRLKIFKSKKALTLVDVLYRLNKVLEYDSDAISQLTALRVDGSRIQRKYPTMRAHRSFYDRPLVGFVELLNLLFDADVDICSYLNSDDSVHSFALQHKQGEEEMKISSNQSGGKTSNRRRRTRRIV